MKKYTMTVLTSPKPGFEEQWNSWHRDEHVADMLKIPGVLSCRRLKRSGSVPEQAPWKYMLSYEVMADNIADFQAEVARRYGTDALPASPFSSPETTIAFFWEDA